MNIDFKYFFKFQSIFFRTQKTMYLFIYTNLIYSLFHIFSKLLERKYIELIYRSNLGFQKVWTKLWSIFFILKFLKPK
jgi:hypothetical protein